ncbi:helix-turn-helix transcriptional regulator [Sulfurimonas sp. SAG-AH-194-I05]|nr:helix-turn-helix transcriptional regulator [Sulfurimonas sp. SAG-AH-194-I05]MDF1875213.1 helix-turn-helix transcriptional regulator [Sulfurimonas sp. SAG-AH-194-I05]
MQQQTTAEELYKTIGRNVSKLRKAKGFSQLDLSLEMGYKSVSVVSGAEIYYNKIHFNIEHLLKISQIFNVELCDLFREDSEPTN